MLGNLLIPYHTKRNARKKVRRFSTSFDEANLVGIICSYKWLIDQGGEIDEFVENLKTKGKKVTTLVFHENSSNTDGIANNSFSKRDLNFFGLWSKEKVKSFVEKEFDYLISLDLEYNIYINSVVAGSRARCRIGIYDDQASEFLELMIKPEDHSIGGLIVGLKDMLNRIKDE